DIKSETGTGIAGIETSKAIKSGQLAASLDREKDIPTGLHELPRQLPRLRKSKEMLHVVSAFGAQHALQHRQVIGVHASKLPEGASFQHLAGRNVSQRNAPQQLPPLARRNARQGTAA